MKLDAASPIKFAVIERQTDSFYFCDKSDAKPMDRSSLSLIFENVILERGIQKPPFID